MAFFGLKLGLDFEMRAAHPHQKFQGVTPPGGKYCPGSYLSVARLEFIPIHCHYRTDDTDLE